MPISGFIDRLLGRGGSSVQRKAYECERCGERFESAKRPSRAMCSECLSDDVKLVDPSG